ncbi:hypothetical protein LSCM4_04427 [Leishmania orientalis]|uniref:Ankyrin repeat protein n=1 Tax=Leishmania orientalis TaxID=2249476 RepID=A0A836GNQ7_9TRYP|nr:hypothetical protein LSCM4_04427 [Leishmania orientalis]
MSWPLDPFVSDGGYTTPLPQQPCEAALWRAVTSLYHCSALAAPKTCWPSAAASSTSPAPAGGKHVSAVEVPHAGTFAECDSVAVPCGSFSTTLSLTRAGVAEGLGAFTTADEVASPLGSPLLFSPPITSPLSPSVAAHLKKLPALHQKRLPRAPTVSSLLPRSRPTGICSVIDDSLASGPTTGDIRATCHRLLEPVQALLAQFDADKLCVGAGVVDLAVQHPLPCLRVEMVRLLLTFKRWNWSMCAPVAVAAGVGDTDVLEYLLSVEELEPNLGFPLTVAVRCYQHERVLPFLLSHPRIKPNHGAAFYVAVAIGNTEAMYILGSAAGVDVNDFANGEGTSALLCALRQFLIFSALEGAAHQPSTSAASAPLHSRRPQQVTPSSSPLPSMAQEGMATISPLLTGWASSGDQALKKHGSLSHPSGNTDNSGAASSAAARASGGTPPAAVPSKAAVPLEQRDDAPLSGDSAVGATGDEHQDAMAAVYEDDDGTHSSAFRQDTVAHPLRTAQHWRVVLLYLLNHPAIEVNAGFYTTPLQIAVFSGNVEVVAWLLQHPRLRPNRLPRAASVLRDSCDLLRRQAFSKDALKSVVATPVEMAVPLHQRETFKLLVRDQRVRLPVRLTMDLERWAWNANAIPYLTILAQHRTDWEGWGWRRRRQCVLIATTASSVVALCSWAVWCVWYDSLRACGTALMYTYAAQVVMSAVLLGWEAFMARAASPAAHLPVSNPVPVLVALVQHLVPAWPGTWRWGATAALLLCPGMVPLLDFVCAWSLYKVYRSRQPLQTAARAGGAAPEPSLHRRPAGPPDNSARCTCLPNDPCERIDRARRHSRWFSSTTHKRAGSSVMSSASSYDSLTDVPCAANLGRTERCSHPQPATARTRRQAVISSGVQRRFHILGSARASATVEGAATVSAHTVTTSKAGRAAASGGEFVSRINSTATNGVGVWPQARRRSSWVVPGRSSRFAVSTEYRAPDLTLRALAYVTYDRILVAPRLLLSCVGIFMFMYMAFPSSPPAAPSPSGAMAEDGSAMETDGTSLLPLLAAAARNGASARSIFTVYYHDRPLSAVPTGAAVMGVATDLANLPRFTITMGLVGLCGLVASIVSGAALLAMAISLRTITTQSFFKSSNDMGNESDRGGDGLVLRHVE